MNFISVVTCSSKMQNTIKTLFSKKKMRRDALTRSQRESESDIPAKIE